MRVISKRSTRPRAKKYPPYDPKLAYAMLMDLYNMQGLNNKGNTRRTGWSNGGAGLTPLGMNPFLDQDYEAPSAPDRLTLDELKELL